MNNIDIGDVVKLLVDRGPYADGITIPAGTQGIVHKIYNYSWIGYRVQFFGFNKSRTVSGNHLEKV